MTVVLAVHCRNGIVIGADSQITEGDRGMSYPGRKLHPMGAHAIWGGSGSRAVLHDLEACFEAEASEIVGARDVAHALQERMVPALRRHYDLYIPEVPGEEMAGTPSAYLLAAGYSHGEPFIIKVDPSGLVGRYERIGFHAIGSGAPMAQQASALLAHFRMEERDVRYGVVALVRVLDALRVSQPMVGGPLDVAEITPEGVHRLDDDAIAQARDRIRRWEEGDRRVLDGLFEDLAPGDGQPVGQRSEAPGAG